MNGNGSGWKNTQWAVITATILAVLTGAVTMWRQFAQVQERQEYLMKLNDSQNQIIASWQDAVHSLQQQTALLGQVDLHTADKLKEHEDFIREILGRLRVVEQRRQE